LADVAGRVGAAVLRRLRLSLVRRGAGRAWLARLAAPSPSQPARDRGPAGDGDRRASRLLRGGLHGRAPRRHEPTDLGGHDAARRDRASFIYALAGPRPRVGASARTDPARRADPPRRHRLFFGPDHVIVGWRSIGVLLAAGVALGCTSPESTRTRGGGAGADVGNHARGAVQLHAGNKIYYGTRT